MDNYTPPQRSISTAEMLKNFEVKKPKPIFNQFLDEAFIVCNKSLVENGHAPRKISYYASQIRLRCKSDTDIHYWMSQCRKGNYSEVFFGVIKRK
jgi:hypothetical protein